MKIAYIYNLLKNYQAARRTYPFLLLTKYLTIHRRSCLCSVEKIISEEPATMKTPSQLQMRLQKSLRIGAVMAM